MPALMNILYNVTRVGRYCIVLFVWLLLLMTTAPVLAQTTNTYTVPEAAEANKLYASTNGAGWRDKWGWPLQMTYTTATIKPAANGVFFFDQVPQLLIKRLDLHNNQLSGNIPNFNLPNLQIMVLNDNQLSGNIPNFNLPNLQGLHLYLNQLNGGIPNFNLPNLQYLELGRNQLNGGIPNFNLPNLRVLSLSNNQLSGGIPNFNLPNLQRLELSNNQLDSGIPNFNLPNLQRLELSGNQLNGTIPNFNLPSLGILDLFNNQLSGNIPSFHLLNLKRIQWLDLSFNQLTGTIPNFNLPSLEYLRLHYNQLTGTIPNFNLPNLQELRLSNNQLSGSDVDWARFSKLIYLFLDMNKLVFRDLEPAAQAMQGKMDFFSYSPQDSVPTLKNGDTLRVDVGGEQTKYQWYRNGQPIIATQAFHKATDTALYFCRATNALLPNLILSSRPVRGGAVISSVLEKSISQNNEQAKDIITALSIDPNPLREQGNIGYSLTRRVPVSIAIYSVLGQKLFTVFEGEQNAGMYVQELRMNAYSSGTYIVRMQAGKSIESVIVHYLR